MSDLVQIQQVCHVTEAPVLVISLALVLGRANGSSLGLGSLEIGTNGQISLPWRAQFLFLEGALCLLHLFLGLFNNLNRVEFSVLHPMEVQQKHRFKVVLYLRLSPDKNGAGCHLLNRYFLD